MAAAIEKINTAADSIAHIAPLELTNAALRVAHDAFKMKDRSDESLVKQLTADQDELRDIRTRLLGR